MGEDLEGRRPTWGWGGDLERGEMEGVDIVGLLGLV